MIYLDHAATTPLPEAVADTMYDVLRHQFGNPSAQYPLGREAKELVEEARCTIAGALGCQPSALHFTSCGTESDNWAIRAATRGGTSSPPPWSTAPCWSLAASWNRRGMRSPTSSPTARDISPPDRWRRPCGRTRYWCP